MIFLLLLSIILPASLRAQQASAEPQSGDSAQEFLISDYTNLPLAAADVSSQPADFTPLDASGAVFSALASASGRELYRTDGSSATLLKDLVPGVASGDPQHFYASGGVAWFWANASADGPRQLWHSDGTPAGTQVFDLAYDQVDTVVEGDTLATVSGRLVFVGADAAGGAELWAWDGASGITRLADINAGAGSADPQPLTVVDGWLYFSAFDGAQWGLWRTDGTAINTTLVQADVKLAATDVLDGALYFRATRADSSCALWRSNGTAAGTQIIVDECVPLFVASVGVLAFVSTDKRSVLTYTPSSGAVTTIYTNTDPYWWISELRAGAANWGAAVLFKSRHILGINSALFRLNLQAGATLTPVLNVPLEQVSIAHAGAERVFIISEHEDNTIAGGFAISTTLWVYDGQQSTQLLQRTRFKSAVVQHLTAWNSGALFAADEPWFSAGTIAGTQQIAEIGDSAPGSSYILPRQVLRNDPVTGIQYISDYVPFGTAVPDYGVTLAVNPAARSITTLRATGSEPYRLGSRTILLPTPPIVITDGETQTVTLPISAGRAYATAYNDALYIFVEEGAGSHLWRTDGTVAGTTDLGASALPVNTAAYAMSPEPFQQLGSKVLAWNDETLWVHDLATNTSSGWAFSLGSGAFLTGQTFLIGDVLYSISIGANQVLWRSDGTPGGTAMLLSAPSVIEVLGQDAQSLYVAVGGSVQRTDPASTSMQQLGDVAGMIEQYQQLPSGRMVLMVHSAGVNTNALWSVDSSGLQQLLAPTNMDWTMPFGNLGTTLLFEWDESSYGNELWVTDGTVAGTQRLTDINPGAADTWIDFVFFSLLNKHLFVASTASGNALWASDGTPAGTVKLADMFSTSINVVGQHMGQLYFTMHDGSGVAGLWVTDGTAAGTYQLRGVDYGAKWPNATFFGIVGSHVLFSIDTAAQGPELWSTQAGAATIAPLGDLYPGLVSSEPELLVQPFNATHVFFSADDGTHGRELYVSDGTPAGTKSLGDINPGAANARLSFATMLGDQLFFAADDGTHGLEPWTSDGTPAGTHMLADVAPGVAGSIGEPERRFDSDIAATFTPEAGMQLFTLVGSYVTFTANDLVHGFELHAIALDPAPSISAPDHAFAPPLGLARLPIALRSGAQPISGAVTLTLTLDPALTYVDDTASVTPTLNGTTLTWVFATPPVEQPWQARVQLPDVPLGTSYALQWSVTTSAGTLTKDVTLTSAAQVFLPSVRR